MNTLTNEDIEHFIKNPLPPPKQFQDAHQICFPTNALWFLKRQYLEAEQTYQIKENDKWLKHQNDLGYKDGRALFANFDKITKYNTLKKSRDKNFKKKWEIQFNI